MTLRRPTRASSARDGSQLFWGHDGVEGRPEGRGRRGRTERGRVRVASPSSGYRKESGMASASNPQDPGDQRQAKRRRRGRALALNVGGEEFAASASTLTSNSHYFAALLSGDWAESGDEELYVDQDPEAFRVLLGYMRSGMVKVSAVDEKVLLLAEFLGVERLVSAAKIRWLVNLGRGPSLSGDCPDGDIVAAFDREYGGISEAIGAGFFRYFKEMNDKAQSEFAEIRFIGSPDGGRGRFSKVRLFIDREDPIENECCLVAAKNGLAAKGFEYIKSISNVLQLYSRRKHIHLQSRSDSVFMPSCMDLEARKKKVLHQLAFFLYNHEDELTTVIAPPEFSHDESVRSNPFGVAIIRPVHECWGDMHGFQYARDVNHVEANLHGLEGVNGDEVGTLKLFSRKLEGVSW
ncbi:hypothetical protein THAOC_08658 [Thalassiosira oceanica]|uniref:BTB domain-containing protein n=1 Tax=Thalassiosira oceanica TaxID=159749 RepID=K0THN0_THAOC|nr:hypothetical protein THAOC_08658 [Thalassiosira oceanica]|eukprot:EJK70022.1 hypothetical protein THAOC_08658 [Thalassiosira oceanica]